jgi:hypothetical protein
MFTSGCVTASSTACGGAVYDQRVFFFLQSSPCSWCKCISFSVTHLLDNLRIDNLPPNIQL